MVAVLKVRLLLRLVIQALLEPAKVETQNIDFTSSKIAASSDAAISASGVAFKKGTAVGFVDFSKYLDEKNIDLSAYESISVEWEVIDKDGNTISDYPDDAIPNNAKVAFVEAGGLNGHSDDVNKDSQYSSNVTGEGYSYTVKATTARIAGVNVQIVMGEGATFPADYQIVVKKITLNAPAA